MDKNHRSKITRAWTVLLGTVVIALGTAGVAQAQAILYGAAHTGSPEGAASTLYTIDPATGAKTAVGAIGFDACSGMDFHPTTGILYATCIRSVPDPTHVLITIDPVTGTGTEVGPTGVVGLGFGFTTMSDISFRNSGDHTLYAYLVDPDFINGPDGVGTINITTGAATALGLSNSGHFGNGIAFSPADLLFHAATVTVGGADGVLSTLNQNTGAATIVTALSFPDCGTGGGSHASTPWIVSPGRRTCSGRSTLGVRASVQTVWSRSIPQRAWSP